MGMEKQVFRKLGSKRQIKFRTRQSRKNTKIDDILVQIGYLKWAGELVRTGAYSFWEAAAAFINWKEKCGHVRRMPNCCKFVVNKTTQWRNRVDSIPTKDASAVPLLAKLDNIWFACTVVYMRSLTHKLLTKQNIIWIQTRSFHLLMTIFKQWLPYKQ